MRTYTYRGHLSTHIFIYNPPLEEGYLISLLFFNVMPLNTMSFKTTLLCDSAWQNAIVRNKRGGERKCFLSRNDRGSSEIGIHHLIVLGKFQWADDSLLFLVE